MTLNGVMAVTLRYFTEFGKPVFQKVTASICGGTLCTSLLYFVVRVRYRRKESSRSLSDLLMSFLFQVPGQTPTLPVQPLLPVFIADVTHSDACIYW